MLKLLLAAFLSVVTCQVNYVAACTENVTTVYVSANGVSWTTTGVVQPSVKSMKAAAFSSISGRWVISGNPDVLGLTTFFSDDALVWSTVSPPDLLLVGLGLTYSDIGSGLWVLCGQNVSASSHIWISSDGQSWAPSAIQPVGLADVRAAAFSVSQNRWVAVGREEGGNSASIAISSDANIWASVGSRGIFGGPVSVGNGVMFSVVNNVWIAVGEGTTQTPARNFLTSVNGVDWVPIAVGTKFFDGGIIIVVLYLFPFPFYIFFSQRMESRKVVRHTLLSQSAVLEGMEESWFLPIFPKGLTFRLMLKFKTYMPALFFIVLKTESLLQVLWEEQNILVLMEQLGRTRI